MTKQKMQLPLTCEKHLHDGYGTSKDVPCPWCEIERLRPMAESWESYLAAQERRTFEPKPSRCEICEDEAGHPVIVCDECAAEIL